ncbi:MAG: peptide chain release factor-like protein [Patescibacteria group bacterium]
MSFNPYQQQLDQIASQIAENQALLADPELGTLAQEEITRLEQEKATLLEASMQFGGGERNSASNDVSKAKAIIEIRGGAGGDEAKIWAEDLLRMYIRYAEIKHLRVEFLDDLVIKLSGKVEIEVKKPPATPDELENSNLEQKPEDQTDTPASPNNPTQTITQQIVSNQEQLTEESIPTKLLYPYDLLKFESGVHRVQRVPVTEAQGRIHTSTASVAVLPEITTAPIEIRDEDLEWQFMRAGGAGGQSVNKTSSAVRLTHKPSGIVVTSSRERKQAQNRQIALDLLYSRLWEIEEERKAEEVGEARSSIGRNMRAEKIRTYNYPQNRVTDHRINRSWYHLSSIMEGELDEVIRLVAK